MPTVLFAIRLSGLAMLALAWVVIALSTPATAQEGTQNLGPLQSLLQDNRALIEESSRRSIGPAIEAIGSSGLDGAPAFLTAWQARIVYQRAADGLFFVGDERHGTNLAVDPDTGETVGEISRDDFDQLRPNGGVRSLIGAALVQFQLSDPNPDIRQEALQAIARDAEESHLGALRAALDGEVDIEILAAKLRLERILAIAFAENEAERIEAIESFSGDIGLDVRAALNPLISTRAEVTAAPEPPATRNVARVLEPGAEVLPRDAAYAQLVSARLAPAIVSTTDVRAALIANIENGSVAGVPVETLDTEEARLDAYVALAEAGVVPTTPTDADIDTALDAHTFFESYAERSSAVTDAANTTLQSIEINLMANEALDFSLDALSLGSIYFLAAIGLAITFGVKGDINMAHGEFIMMVAYTGYVDQLFV
ncbi:MAG: urea ABC transporter permease subunit UrtB, partial [Cohaesibacteraceae bacterium]